MAGFSLLPRSNGDYSNPFFVKGRGFIPNLPVLNVRSGGATPLPLTIQTPPGTWNFIRDKTFNNLDLMDLSRFILAKVVALLQR